MKKLYWLKLKDTFFTDPKIKKLRRIAGGDTYTIIYQKMMLLSLKDEGVIEFEGIENTLAEELALIMDEETDNVKVTLSFLQANGLIEALNDTNFLLNQMPNLIGKESDSAGRTRKHRQQKALHCNSEVTDGNENVTTENKREENKRIREKREESNTPLIPQGINQEAWTDWAQHRKEIKKPLTPTAMEKQFKLLLEYPYDQKEIIDQSIQNSWQGLFAPKRTPQQKNLAQRNREAFKKYEELMEAQDVEVLS